MNIIDIYENEDSFERIPWSGCWIWKNGLFAKGYGALSYGRSVHRVFYELGKGPIPDGMQVLHTCNIKCCCNPDHLYAGTHMDNVRDAMERDRYGPKFIQTHCWRGHEFTEENTYLHRGHRSCKTCWKLKPLLKLLRGES